MKTVKDSQLVPVRELAGSFAEDKDAARKIRVDHLMPAVRNGKKIVLDFAGVDVATQSFIHAMISEAICSQGVKALDLIEFKSCNRAVKSVVLTVLEYLLDAPVR